MKNLLKAFVLSQILTTFASASPLSTSGHAIYTPADNVLDNAKLKRQAEVDALKLARENMGCDPVWIQIGKIAAQEVLDSDDIRIDVSLWFIC